MPWKIAATLYFLMPFALVAIPFLVVETARVVATIRAERCR
ncbi:MULTISPECIES: hypothetical protein [Methylosinus]|nr:MULTISPECIES: hypothetical protein [Methylosinus]